MEAIKTMMKSMSAEGKVGGGVNDVGEAYDWKRRTHIHTDTPTKAKMAIRFTKIKG